MAPATSFAVAAEMETAFNSTSQPQRRAASAAVTTSCTGKAMTQKLAILMTALVFAAILLAAVPGWPVAFAK